MFKLDDNLLRELGLGSLPAHEKNRMLGHIYETLEMRVGMKLAERMTNQQLDEFEAFIDRNDEAGALRWLETNFPNYKQVVADELEALKGEIKVAAPQIVAASQAQPLAAPQPTGPPATPPPMPQQTYSPAAQPPASMTPPPYSPPPPAPTAVPAAFNTPPATAAPPAVQPFTAPPVPPVPGQSPAAPTGTPNAADDSAAAASQTAA
jgi:hypothetical protein